MAANKERVITKLLSIALALVVALTAFSSPPIPPQAEAGTAVNAQKQLRPPGAGVYPPGIDGSIKETKSQPGFFSAAGSMRPAISHRPTTGDQKLLVIMLEFNDVKFTHNKDFYYNLIFGETNSLKAYYRENSYGKLNLVSNINDITVVQSVYDMAYYGADNGGIDSPEIDEMAREAVRLADAAGVDFSRYATGGVVNNFLLIHAGQDQALTGNSNDIWSHQYFIYERENDLVTSIGETVDGVEVIEYATVADDGYLGTMVHEFGHQLGLPDLYDTDYGENGESFGAGVWDSMAYGCDLGGGARPAHLSAWSKQLLGWIEPVNVVYNDNYSISEAVYGAGEAAGFYRLWTNGQAGDEYFLVENRRKYGFDAELPGEGLLIWHIDDAVGDLQYNNINIDPSNLRVALEQADGKNDLENLNNAGDAGDPFSTLTSTEFSQLTNPSSNRKDGSPSYVSITNISAPADVMTAHFTVEKPVTGTISLDKTQYTGTGATAIITVNDADRDTDSSINTITVEVTSTSDAGGIDVALNETGAGTGIFTGSFGFTTGASGNNLIKVAGGDTITATYFDQLNAAGETSILTATATWSQSTTTGGGGGGGGGGITAPQVTVPPGATKPQSDAALEKAIENSSATGIIKITAEPGEDNLALTTKQVEKIEQTQKPLTIQIPGISFTFPAGALQVPEMPGKDVVQFEIGARALGANEKASILNNARHSHLYILRSEIYDLSAVTVTRSGHKNAIKLFNGNVMVALPVPANYREAAARGKIKAYRYNPESKAWDAVGGDYDAATTSIVFETPHFSHYALLEMAPKKLETSPFTDIENHWAKDDIEWMYTHNYASGRSPSRFEPNTGITRAEFAALLVNVLQVGKPA
ncbi:M6 family metalloprotease domain-containing protein, partial [Desulfoscipio geothermicus]